MRLINLTYTQLLTYGVHLGHTLANTNIYAAWMIYTRKHQLVILNIFKTYFILKMGFKCIDYAVRLRCPVWFVNLDKSAYNFSKFAAYSCGEFYWAENWRSGLIANYPQFYKIYKQAFRSLSEWSYSIKRSWISKRFYDWRLTRTTWPRAVFISSVSKSKEPVLECNTVMIPCIGITDSDIDSGLVMFPVPGNDESLESLCYYSDIVANHILIRKFEQIIFFISQRPISRYMNFRNWLLNKYLTQSEAYLNEKEPIKLKIHVGSLQTIFSTNILSAIHLLFGRNLKTANNKLSYFSFRPKTSSKFEANIFAYTMLSRLRLRWAWLCYLSRVHTALDFWKWNPFNVRKGSKSLFSWTKSSRIITNYRWDNKYQFLRYCLRHYYFKKYYLTSDRYIFDILGLKGITIPRMAKCYLKYNYLLKFNMYSSKSWRIHDTFSSNYYLKYLVEQLYVSNFSKDWNVGGFTTFARNSSDLNKLSYTPLNLFKMLKYSQFFGKAKKSLNVKKIINTIIFANYLVNVYLNHKRNYNNNFYLNKLWVSLVPKLMRYIQYIFNNPYIIKNSSLNFKDLMSCLNYIAAKLNIFIIQKEELDEERNQKLYELGNNLKRNFWRKFKKNKRKHKLM